MRGWMWGVLIMGAVFLLAFGVGALVAWALPVDGARQRRRRGQGRLG